MKKIFAIMLAFAMLLTACSSKPEVDTIKDGKSLADVMDTVDAAYTEAYGQDGASIVNMRVSISDEFGATYLSDMCKLSEEDIAESYGWFSGSITNSDNFIGIKAAEGKIEAVKTALEERLQAIVDQYEFYPVNGSYERALAGKVHVRGDYAFLIVTGSNPDDPSTFDAEVQFAIDKINEQFN